MSLLPKHTNCSKGLYVRQCEDRISNLPSSLITKIISYLPTKNAVATSVLSTKWKRSWYSITNLDFSDELTVEPHTIDLAAPIFRKLTCFVNKVLLLCDKSCLERFHLKSYHVSDNSFVYTWLIAVLQCNLKELDVFIGIRILDLLPSDIFLCSTLVVLKLDVRGYVNIPTSVCLPSLKFLHIDRVQFSNDKSISSLLSGCPVLEELCLIRCLGSDVRAVNITSRVLKTLEMESLDLYVPPVPVHVRYQITMDTPRLEYFRFEGYVAKVNVVSNMDHLIKAEINFYDMGEDISTDQFNDMYFEAVNDFLILISRVETLVLCCDSMMVMNECHFPVPKFSNLTYLKLYLEGDILPELLLNSPCLQTLHIQQGEFCEEKGNRDVIPSQVPSCFLFHLKEIEIDGFEGFKDEIQLVEYILKNAKALENLTLHSPRSDLVEDVERLKIEAEWYKKLLAYPRASSLCKVVIS